MIVQLITHSDHEGMGSILSLPDNTTREQALFAALIILNLTLSVDYGKAYSTTSPSAMRTEKQYEAKSQYESQKGLHVLWDKPDTDDKDLKKRKDLPNESKVQALAERAEAKQKAKEVLRQNHPRHANKPQNPRRHHR